MTTFEHALLGVTAALASGLDRRYGWPIVAVAGAAAVSPDWDGLSLLLGAAAYAQVHRAWGHSLLIACLVGAAVGAVDFRWHVSLRLKRWLAAWVRMPPSPDEGSAYRGPVAVWMVVGALAALTHLAADLVVSGAETANDWGLKLLWPISHREWVYPLVRWGDPGMSI
jgi:membrane-bound metal-dependent hydrolase YbcI (DUF457 family)